MLKILILGIIWGSAFAVTRFVTSNGVNPITYSFLLVTIPAIIMTLYCWQTKRLFLLITQNTYYYCIAGLLGIVIPNTTTYYLARHLPSGLLAITVGTTPFFIYPLALLTKDEYFNIKRFIGILCCGIGIILLSINNSNFDSITINFWLLISLITPLCYATCTIFIAKHKPKNNTFIVLTTGMLIASTIFLIPFVFLTINYSSLAHLLAIKIDIAIFGQSFLVIFGYILVFNILTKFGSVNYSVVNGIGGIIGILWGWIIFHETLSTYSIWAIICILTGAWLINM